MSATNTQAVQLTQSYPTYDLSPACIEVGEIIANHGGAKAPVDKSQIAAGMHTSESSSIFSPRIAAARSFGVITGRGQFMLTESGRRYFEPHSDSDRRSALLNFLASPSVFSKFIETYDGSKIAAGAYLANIFQQLGVGKSWAPRVATIFTKAAELAGALDSQGFLRYKASMKNVGMATAATTIEPSLPSTSLEIVPTVSPETPNLQSSKPYEGAVVWVYSEAGIWLKVETPQNISKELWDRLNSYIQVIKPSK